VTVIIRRRPLPNHKCTRADRWAVSGQSYRTFLLQSSKIVNIKQCNLMIFWGFKNLWHQPWKLTEAGSCVVRGLGMRVSWPRLDPCTARPGPRAARPVQGSNPGEPVASMDWPFDDVDCLLVRWRNHEDDGRRADLTSMNCLNLTSHISLFLN